MTYGATAYGQAVLGGSGDTATSTDVIIAAPLISNPVALYAPTLTAVFIEGTIAPPRITSTTVLYAPAMIEMEATIPIARDVRIMRVRRSE